MPGERRLERETGIEPATNSLEGCDSTTELLPPSRSRARSARASAGKPAAFAPRTLTLARRFVETSPRACDTRLSNVLSRLAWPNADLPSPTLTGPAEARKQRAKAGGEGRTRTFEATRATDLQSAAFDRSATSPVVCVGFVDVDACPADRTISHSPVSHAPVSRPERPFGIPMELAKGFEPPTG
jgi:hypothetical protein